MILQKNLLCFKVFRNYESAKSCRYRALVSLVGHLFLWVRVLVGQWFLVGQNFYLVGRNIFLKGQKVLLFFLSKANILLPWINLGCFDRPR